MPSTYKASTYAVAGLWQESTKISYKPNPKSGKSFDRYASYEKAKTMGESLKLGSKAIDLLFDFEHGHLEVKGPLRKEPIDFSVIKNFKDLTYTDMVLSGFASRVNVKSKEENDRIDKDLAESLREHRAHQRRLRHLCQAGSAGFEDADDLRENKGNFESAEMLQQRCLAEQEAKYVLDYVAEKGLKVSDHEVLRVLRLWGFRHNELRRNVMRDGQTFVYSDTAGAIAERTGKLMLKEEARLYPTFCKLLNQWLRDHMPEELAKDFVWTSININKNYAGRLHRDGNNQGPSIIKAFGDFTGGSLNYFPDDNRSSKLEELPRGASVKHDISKGLLMFDGNRGHEVDAFKGERYSLVWFSCPRFWKLDDEGRKQLKERGFNFPSKASTVKLASKLSPPQGYGKKAATSKSKDTKLPKTKASSAPQSPFIYHSHMGKEKLALEAAAKKHWAKKKAGAGKGPAVDKATPFDSNHKRKKEVTPWSVTMQVTIGAKLSNGKKYFLDGPKNMVDGALMLNANDPKVPTAIQEAGYCAVYSNRLNIYYALYKDGRRHEAMAAFGLDGVGNANQVHREGLKKRNMGGA